MRTWNPAFVAVGLSLAVGCSEAIGPNLGGIEVALALSDEEMVVGDTVEIRVVATNTTANPVSFATNTCVLVVRVLDESNTPVVRLPGFCNDIRLEHTLGPGESLAQVFQFDGTFETFPLASGTYMVFAGISSDLLNPSDAVELRIQP